MLGCVTNKSNRINNIRLAASIIAYKKGNIVKTDCCPFNTFKVINFYV